MQKPVCEYTQALSEKPRVLPLVTRKTKLLLFWLSWHVQAPFVSGTLGHHAGHMALRSKSCPAGFKSKPF